MKCGSAQACQNCVCRLGMLALVILVLAVGTAFFHPRMPSYQQGKMEDGAILLANLPDEVLWVDARSDAEYQLGHIPGAVLLHEDNWESLLPGLLQQWHPEQTVVVYCGAQSCHLSRAVAERLRRDFPEMKVFHLQEGWEGWQQTRN